MEADPTRRGLPRTDRNQRSSTEATTITAGTASHFTRALYGGKIVSSVPGPKGGDGLLPTYESESAH